MNDPMSLALWFVLAVVIYGVLARGLFRATDGARQSLVPLSDILIDNPRFPKSEHAFIETALNEAHRARSAWKMAGAAILVLLRSPFVRPASTTDAVPDHLEKSFDKFCSYWIVAAIGNSPFAAIIFATAMILAVAIRLSSRSFTRAILEYFDHRDGRHRAAA